MLKHLCWKLPLYLLLSISPHRLVDPGTDTDIATYKIHRILFCARGPVDTNERCCFAFTCSHGNSAESAIFQSHVFQCEAPEVVSITCNKRNIWDVNVCIWDSCRWLGVRQWFSLCFCQVLLFLLPLTTGYSLLSHNMAKKVMIIEILYANVHTLQFNKKTDHTAVPPIHKGWHVNLALKLGYRPTRHAYISIPDVTFYMLLV